MSEMDPESMSGPASRPAHEPAHLDRRRLMQWFGALGVGNAVFARALVAQAEAAPVKAATAEMLDQAEWIAGIDLTEDERALMLEGINEMLGEFQTIRAVALDNSVAPALQFNAAPNVRAPAMVRAPAVPTWMDPVPRPESDADLAFASIGELGGWLRDRVLTSVELTRIYLDRLEELDPKLRCVVSRTEDLAMEQAEAADRALQAGDIRGPLHGIPWGAKDLLDVPGYPTTWGAAPYKTQVRENTATVVERLGEAGAVLVAKLSLGALAMGDVWFDATTKNPWNLEQGSSGSSAGSASATAAGLVGFSIGTETLGSIVSPSTRCGTTGLRPTFGRVSRHGAMALSWSMDKIGPICRSVDDCALVFAAVHGADGKDATAVDRTFIWPHTAPVEGMRIGYVPAHFEDDRTADVEDADRRAGLAEWQRFDQRTLETLRRMGLNMVPIELPDQYPVGELLFLLSAEAACAFDDLTRSGKDDHLVRQTANAWPNIFRQGQLIPAVEYLRANRIRTLLMQEMKPIFEKVDVYLTPSYFGGNLQLTNLTGHPSVVLPNGYREGDGTPTSITFTGDLFGEAALLAVAKAYQEATDFHGRRPPMANEEKTAS